VVTALGSGIRLEFAGRLELAYDNSSFELRSTDDPAPRMRHVYVGFYGAKQVAGLSGNVVGLARPTSVLTAERQLVSGMAVFLRGYVLREAAVEPRHLTHLYLHDSVFHDDQHGTAVVVLAALLNAARVTGRSLSDLRAVVSGAGAAGIAVTNILLEAGIGDIAVGDSRGIISSNREDLPPIKADIAARSNRLDLEGSIEEAMHGADVFIGLSAGTVGDAAVGQVKMSPIRAADPAERAASYGDTGSLAGRCRREDGPHGGPGRILVEGDAKREEDAYPDGLRLEAPGEHGGIDIIPHQTGADEPGEHVAAGPVCDQDPLLDLGAQLRIIARRHTDIEENPLRRGVTRSSEQLPGHRIRSTPVGVITREGRHQLPGPGIAIGRELGKEYVGEQSGFAVVPPIDRTRGHSSGGGHAARGDALGTVFGQQCPGCLDEGQGRGIRAGQQRYLGCFAICRFAPGAWDVSLRYLHVAGFDEPRRTACRRGRARQADLVEKCSPDRHDRHVPRHTGGHMARESSPEGVPDVYRDMAHGDHRVTRDEDLPGERQELAALVQRPDDRRCGIRHCVECTLEIGLDVTTYVSKKVRAIRPPLVEGTRGIEPASGDPIHRERRLPHGKQLGARGRSELARRRVVFPLHRTSQARVDSWRWLLTRGYRPVA